MQGKCPCNAAFYDGATFEEVLEAFFWFLNIQEGANGCFMAIYLQMFFFWLCQTKSMLIYDTAAQKRDETIPFYFRCLCP